MGGFNCPDIFWRSKTAKHKQCRRGSWKALMTTVLSQVVKDPTRNAGLPNLRPTNREGLVGHAPLGAAMAAVTTRL